MTVELPTDMPEPSTWQVESLRLTAFPSPSAQFTSSDWWRQVTGEAPETIVTDTKKVQHQEAGPIDSGKLILISQPERIDWLYSAMLEEGATPVDLQNALLPLDEAVGAFRRWMDRWFELSPLLRRLAFGAIVVVPVTSRREGYLQLRKYLSHIELDPETTDFMYQINRPRRSEIMSGLRLNRLTRWSMVSYSRGRLDLTGASPQVVRIADEFAMRLELDINTEAEYQGEYESAQLPSLFAELVGQGLLIAVQGDI